MMKLMVLLAEIDRYKLYFDAVILPVDWWRKNVQPNFLKKIFPNLLMVVYSLLILVIGAVDFQARLVWRHI